jgi:hypothetical protein
MYVTEIAEGVLEHAHVEANYNDGWDVVVETMDLKQVEDYLWDSRKTPKSVAGGIAKMQLFVDIYKERRAEALADTDKPASSEELIAEADADAAAVVAEADKAAEINEEDLVVDAPVEAKPAPKPRAPRKSRANKAA